MPATLTNVPLDFPCPTCKAPPGMPCAIEQLRQTPRQFLKAIQGDTHRARFRTMERHNARMAKRGYSRDFTPKTERRVQLMIDRVPPTLLNAARAKAKREGVSIRALVLGWLREWVEGSR